MQALHTLGQANNGDMRNARAHARAYTNTHTHTHVPIYRIQKCIEARPESDSRLCRSDFHSSSGISLVEALWIALKKTDPGAHKTDPHKTEG